MSEPNIEWTKEHGSLLQLLSEKRDTLSTAVSTAVKVAAGAKTLTPTVVHAVGRALEEASGKSEQVSHQRMMAPNAGKPAAHLHVQLYSMTSWGAWSSDASESTDKGRTNVELSGAQTQVTPNTQGLSQLSAAASPACQSLVSASPRFCSGSMFTCRLQVAKRASGGRRAGTPSAPS